MTAPEVKRAVRTWWVPASVIALGIVIAINYALLIPAIKRQGEQARQGQKARTRQQSVFPISVKVYTDEHRRGVITADELTCFKTGRNCPVTRTKGP